MPRFVVLLHETPHDSDWPTHWDFMIEDGDSLATWALEHEPCSITTIVAKSLAPHRLDYLDYEGPISGDRGNVSQWDSGSFEWRSRDDDCIVIVLKGSKLHAIATVRRQNDHWQFSVEPVLPGADLTGKDANH